MDNPASPPRENLEPIAVADNGESNVDPPLPPEPLPAVRALGMLLGGRPAARAELPTLPGYEILGELGRGGMGVVYQARQVGLKRIVALKMVVAGPFGGSDSVARLRAEAEAAARLRHPHIVQVYEIGEWKGLPFFSLEYMDAGTLAERLQRSPLAPGDAALLLETLARAVDAAHAQGIIHRDLKPGNILLQKSEMRTAKSQLPADSFGSRISDFIPKIADFGLAKRLDAGGNQTRTGAILGTPSYMAPEQAAGHSQAVGPGVDVYALGAILYEALTGRPPFHAGNELQTLEQVRTQEPVSLRRLQPRLPRDLETICLKCLQKEPRKRYLSAAALADDLQRFRAGEPILARPVPAWERAVKWTRRHPTRAALAGISAAVAAGTFLGITAHNVRLSREVNRAETDYREARAVINQMLARLEERSVADVPGLKELQRAQLEDALTFYERILQERDGPDPTRRLDFAQACEQAARLEAKLGRREPAEANFRRALKVFEELAAARPHDAEAQARLAECCHSLGGFLSETVNYWLPESWSEEALSALERSLAVRARLAEADPTNPHRLHDVVRSYLSLGQLYQASEQRWSQAEGHLARAFERGQVLLHDHVGVPKYRATMVRVLSSRADVYLKTGRIEAANAAFTDAERLLENLVEDTPGDLDYAVNLASLYAHWASFLHGTSRPEEAVAVAGRAVTRMEELLRREPTYVPARRALITAYGWRVYANDVLHRYDECVKDWDRIIALDDTPLRNFRRSERAVALGRAGQHSRAADAAAELIVEKNTDSATLYNVACAFAQAARSVGADASLSETERAMRAERHAADAVAVLQRLNRTGFFRDAGAKESLRQDLSLDLAPLRPRTDFEALVREVLP